MKKTNKFSVMQVKFKKLNEKAVIPTAALAVTARQEDKPKTRHEQTTLSTIGSSHHYLTDNEKSTSIQM